jgi:hypothetical protein
VSERVSEVVASGGVPVVVFDLDSTLYEVQPRTYQIVQEFLLAPEAEQIAAFVREALGHLSVELVQYSMRDGFINLGLDLEQEPVKEALRVVGEFWWARFFKSEYVLFDVAYPGTQAYVSSILERGALVVYLTGRDEPNMGAGTREALHRDGFPVEHERVKFMLKPDPAMNDRQFKENALKEMLSLGEVVASFENEPANLVSMQAQLPSAIHVFVDTVCSDHRCKPAKNLYKINGFLT